MPLPTKRNPWCPLGKCPIPGLGQEMCNMNLEYLIAKSEKALIMTGIMTKGLRRQPE